MKLEEIEKKLKENKTEWGITWGNSHIEFLLGRIHRLKEAIEKFKKGMDEYLVDQDIDPIFQELYKSLEDL